MGQTLVCQVWSSEKEPGRTLIRSLGSEFEIKTWPNPDLGFGFRVRRKEQAKPWFLFSLFFFFYSSFFILIFFFLYFFLIFFFSFLFFFFHFFSFFFTYFFFIFFFSHFFSYFFLIFFFSFFFFHFLILVFIYLSSFFQFFLYFRVQRKGSARSFLQTCRTKVWPCPFSEL